MKDTLNLTTQIDQAIDDAKGKIAKKYKISEEDLNCIVELIQTDEGSRAIRVNVYNKKQQWRLIREINPQPKHHTVIVGNATNP